MANAVAASLESLEGDKAAATAVQWIGIKEYCDCTITLGGSPSEPRHKFQVCRALLATSSPVLEAVLWQPNVDGGADNQCHVPAVHYNDECAFPQDHFGTWLQLLHGRISEGDSKACAKWITAESAVPLAEVCLYFNTPVISALVDQWIVENIENFGKVRSLCSLLLKRSCLNCDGWVGECA